MKKDNDTKKKVNNKNTDLMNHGTFFNNPHSVAFEPANTWKVKERSSLRKINR